jgi:hypothetical protein
MTPHRWIAAFLLTLIAGGQGISGEPAPECFLQRLAPAGGWHPYGGPLCWWDPCCFPRCGGPDDYCRKSLPRVCWPPYPFYYTWGPPQTCCPGHRCGRAGNELQEIPHR